MNLTIQQTAEFLSAHDGYLILTHVRPDGDTVGCAAALCRGLRDLGKTAFVLPNPETTSLFSPYLEGLLAPEGFAPETVVSVDMAARGLFPDNAKKYLERVELAIDHHPSQEFFARNTCLDAQRAACGELMYDILREMTPITREIALPLYVAVSTDCGCFVYGNTSAGTHRVAAALIDTGIPLAELNKRHFRTKSFKRLRLESMLTESLEFHDSGSIAIAAISLDMMSSLQADERDAEDIAAFVGQVEGGQNRRHHPGAEARRVQDLPAHRPRRPERQRRVRHPGGRRPRRRRRGHRGGGHPPHQGGPDGRRPAGAGTKPVTPGGHMANGILIIDKPQDWTSQDVCAKLRGVFHEKRIGHAGTPGPHGHRGAPGVRGPGHPGGGIRQRGREGVPGRACGWGRSPTPRTSPARCWRPARSPWAGRTWRPPWSTFGGISSRCPPCTPLSRSGARSSMSWPEGQRGGAAPPPHHHLLPDRGGAAQRDRLPAAGALLQGDLCAHPVSRRRPEAGLRGGRCSPCAGPWPPGSPWTRPAP